VDRLKVLHLITTLPRLSGAADNTRYTVNLLDPERYEVHLACGPAELDASGVRRHVQMFVVETLVRPVAMASDLRAFGTLRTILQKERYDLVHTHNAKAGVLGRIAAKVTRVPIIVHTAHSISFVASESAAANWTYRLADQACARWTSKIITVSSVNTTSYLDAGIGRPEQYVTIYSGVETAKYLDRSARDGCRKELGFRNQDLVAVWIGRLNRQKDPVTCVRAAKLLADRFPQMYFLMVGDDPLGEDLAQDVRRAIEELGLGAKVRLLGYRADVNRILAAADLVLHTSLYEGLGRSIVETMLAGTPLVATAVDGVREAVVSGERGGLLVPPKNPTALAEAAVRLISEPGLAEKVTVAGRAWARDRFAVEKMVTSIDQLYQELWQARQKGSR
jgi:glycosyltransferase involved in cell wall biosynthesis